MHRALERNSRILSSCFRMSGMVLGHVVSALPPQPAQSSKLLALKGPLERAHSLAPSSVSWMPACSLRDFDVLHAFGLPSSVVSIRTRF
jgi:hypothetical protein